MSIDTSTGTKTYVPEYAAGTKTYKTEHGTYTVDLTNKQIDQRDIAALDRTVVDGEVRQAQLVAIMQKYDDFVLVDSKGRGLDSPGDLLREDPAWDEMKDDIGSIFAEATRLFAKAAQESRQRQLEEAETSRKDILSLAATEKDTDYKAAEAAQKAAITEAAVGIGGAVLGAAGGAYGIYKAGKGQKIASQSSAKSKEGNKLEAETLAARKDLDLDRAGTTKKIETNAMRKQEIPGLATHKRAEIEKSKQELDSLKLQRRENEINEDDNTATDTAIAAKKNEIAFKKAEEKNLAAEYSNLDGMNKVATTKHQDRQTRYNDLEQRNGVALKELRQDAADFQADAQTKGDWGRIMGGAFQALSTGINMAGKGAAAPGNMDAETLRADSKYIAAQKESESVMQSQHSDNAAHSRDMFGDAISSGRSMQQSTQDTLNRISANA